MHLTGKDRLSGRKLQTEVSYNIQEICKEYSVERDRIVGLPYHFELEESVKNGTVLSFLNRGYFQPMNKEMNILSAS